MRRSTRHHTDMFAVHVTALLCLLAVGHSAPTSCENLLQPLDPLESQHLVGSWVLIAGSLHDPTHVNHFKNSDSITIIFADSSDSSAIAFTRSISVADTCQYVHTNITLEGSGFTLPQLNVTNTFLKAPCSDCLVMRFDNLAREPQRMYLLSKTREVEQEVMEEFTAQTACLNMTPPILKDPTKVLCPDQRQATS